MPANSNQSHVFPRHCHSNLPVAVKGAGVFLIDAQGRHYLDACGGAAVSCLGHSNAHVRTMIKNQIDHLSFAHTGFFTSESAETLADRLIERAPEGLERVYFVSGGSEAMETAIKLARQYFLEKGQPQRYHVIARRQSYHGNTLGALAAGGNQWRRAQFEPLLANAMHHVSPCHAWRWQHKGEEDQDYVERLANELEQTILMLGDDRVMAFIAEPVVGATMGAVPAVEGYFKAIKAVCQRYGVLLILDEVMCGMGRTGTLFACEQDGVAPDMITIAKGLAAGYQPIGAVLVKGEIYQAIEQGSGFFQHGHTYIGHATACAAGNAVLDEIDAHNLLKNVQDKGQKLRQRLEEQFQTHPYIGNIRGRGLFLGLELVQNRESKQAFDPALGLAGRLKNCAMSHGLMIYPGSGTIDGKYGDHILLAPPFIIEDDHIDMIIDKLANTVEDVLSGLDL